jgi:protein-tyrosine-phosphatase
MKYVLFVCTHNAGRSQMAQAFFERYAPSDLRAESAGQEPAEDSPTHLLGRRLAREAHPHR